MTSEIVSFNEWQKLDLRVGQIEEIEEIEGADKLYKLTVDAGEEIGKRTICAGIKLYFSKEELKDRKIVIFVNLDPRMMRGIESQGMLLAAGSKEDDKIFLLSVDKDAPNGSKIS